MAHSIRGRACFSHATSDFCGLAKFGVWAVADVSTIRLYLVKITKNNDN